jgi:hypothetical protein
VIGLLERAAGFAADDPAATKLDKLEALLALSRDDVTAAAPLLAALLSLETDARYPPLDMSPHRQKERTLEEACTGQIRPRSSCSISWSIGCKALACLSSSPSDPSSSHPGCAMPTSRR